MPEKKTTQRVEQVRQARRRVLLENLSEFILNFFEPLRSQRELTAETARNLFLDEFVSYGHSGFALPLAPDVKAFGPLGPLLMLAYEIEQQHSGDLCPALDEVKRLRDERRHAGKHGDADSK